MLILRIGKIQYYSNTLKRLQQISYLNGCPKYLIREKKTKTKKQHDNERRKIPQK